jgi:membrane fusion protein (multidrug efflux system)
MADAARADTPNVTLLRKGPAPATTVDPAARRKKLRTRLFTAFGVVLALGAAGAGTWWYIAGARYISTDDAYVGADSAEITPQIAATISDVPVADTMHVKRGDVLVRLDPADSALAEAQAEANYAVAIRHVQQYFANASEAAAQVAARQSDLDRATLDYDRRIVLAKDGVIANEQLTTFKNTYETARANVLAAQQTEAAQQALIHGSDVEHNPEVVAARVAMDNAKLNLSRTVIRAPFDGVVAQKAAQIGERVQVGQSLMSVVPVDHVYVDANFKEGQLTRVHQGQPVTLTSDLYGSGVVFHGHVAGLSGGTGSAFAVIPAQNATGNWIKVVQRLPVRIALDSQELAQHPLRVGLSMTATIDAQQ